MKHIFLLPLFLVGCGKTEPIQPVQPDTGAAPAGQADVAEQASVDSSADGAADAAEDASPDKALMERLAVLEVPGMTRVRGDAQPDHVTLQFTTNTPNAKGNTATIEVTIGRCAGCALPPLAERETRKDQSLAQLGELHAKNPKLVFALEDIELAPQRSAAATYVRSFVDDGVTRAAMHTLEVVFIGNEMNLRMMAYPRTPFPTTQAEVDEAFAKDELIAATREIYKAAAAILWP